MHPRTPIRHGEVLLFPVDTAPAGTVTRVLECIVGHSESGHHHVLESDEAFAEIVAANGDLYIDLDVPTPLRHHKAYYRHRELMVPPGVWRVLRKTEFDITRLSPTAPEPPIRPRRIADADFHDEDLVRRAARPVSD